MDFQPFDDTRLGLGPGKPPKAWTQRRSSRQRSSFSVLGIDALAGLVDGSASSAMRPSVSAADRRTDAPREHLLRLAAVERDRLDRRMRFEQRRDVVRHFARDEDAAVEAAGPLAVLEHVPDADARGMKARDALGVWKLRPCVVERAHEGQNRFCGCAYD